MKPGAFQYYSPGLGRFFTKDPNGGDLSDPLSLNPYMYCDDNPVSKADPEGLWGMQVHKTFTRKWIQAYLSHDRGINPAFASSMATVISDVDGRIDSGSKTKSEVCEGRHTNTRCRKHPSQLDYVRDAFDNALFCKSVGNEFAAWVYLGEGLHSLQDYYAHGIHIRNGVHDKSYKGYIPDADHKYTDIRFYYTWRETDRYIGAYLEGREYQPFRIHY